MRRFLILMLCAFMLLSHGGIVAAHSHGFGATHDDHGGLHANGHGRDHAGAPVSADEEGPQPHSPVSHNHVSVDAIAKAPVLARAGGATLCAEPPSQRDADPPSATVAPGLEPPDA